jgi:hypothetical protein
LEPSKPKSKEEILKYFTQKLPGSVEEQEVLLEDIKEFLEDHGEAWVWNSRERLLLEAQFLIDEGL